MYQSETNLSPPYLTHRLNIGLQVKVIKVSVFLQDRIFHTNLSSHSHDLTIRVENSEQVRVLMKE